MATDQAKTTDSMGAGGAGGAHAAVAVEVGLPLDQARALAERALKQVGTLKPSEPGKFIAKVRHGPLRAAKAHVWVETLSANRSVINIESKGIDLTGKTQRSATRRVVDAINRGHEPGYTADRWGEPVWMSVATVVGIIGVGLLMALVVKPHEWFK